VLFAFPCSLNFIFLGCRGPCCYKSKYGAGKIKSGPFWVPFMASCGLHMVALIVELHLNRE
jgi:hypothetical protein